MHRDILTSALPKALLLSGTAPGDNGVGAIILRDLCRMLPKESLCAFLIAPAAMTIRSGEELSWLPFQTARDCDWKLSGSRMGRLLKWPINAIRNRRQVRKLVGEAASFARLHKVELIWAVLDSPTTIAIARKVAKELGIPYVAMIWDDIHHNLPYFGVYRLSQLGLLREWEQTLRHASRCAVIGETMKAEYDREYGTDAIILRHGVSPDLIRRPAPIPSVGGPIRIGFIGSVTAGTAFQAFIRALDMNGWRLCGREVHLKLAGHRFDLRCHHAANIEYLGWRSLQESIAMLSESDINYLPQPFEHQLQSMSQLSFPTKLTSYLAAGRPVLLHCPETASLFRFFQEHPFGAWMGSLEPTEIVAKLEQLLTDQQAYSDCVRAGRVALEQEFSSTRFHESFAKFMGFELIPVEGQGDLQKTSLTLQVANH